MLNGLLCGDLIERDREIALLAEALDDLGRGIGGVVLLVGEAGAGKTRLAREGCVRARSLGLAVLFGRCVPGSSPVPYRPLTEALLPAFRDARPDRDPTLAGFEAQLAKLVPAWGPRSADAPDESPVLLGEAVLRLLRLVGAGTAGGCVLLLEDLHWADAETLAVIEYLADTLRDQPILCLGTTRPDAEEVHALGRLARSPAVRTLDLARLSRDGVEAVVLSCLGASSAPPEVIDCVAANSEGNPFLIEELLAGLVTSGALSRDGGQWRSTGRLIPTIPFDFGESVRQRLGTLDDTARHVVRAAALLGRRFDWELLPGLVEVDGRAVVDGLRLALAAQIVEVDGNEFRFRHALTREAILAELLPPDRRRLARRALPAVERAHPGLPGGWCELAADLAQLAGLDAVAALHLAESARRALAAGALTSAERIAVRARNLGAGPGGDPGVRAAVDQVLIRTLTMAGKPAEAAALGEALAEYLESESTSGRMADAADRLADLQVVLARAALTGGDTERAQAMIDRARALVDGDAVSLALAARVEAVAAHVALARGDWSQAREFGSAAVEHAAATDQPAVECEALEVLGCADREAGESPSLSPHFARGIALAERHGLTAWLIRVKHEAAMMRAVSTADLAPLSDVRELAGAHGALVTVASVDLVLADFALANFDAAACQEHAARCVAASRPYRLAMLPIAQLWLAGAHALTGAEAAMEAAAAEALHPDPDDPRVLGDLWGRVRGTLAIVRDDRDGLRTALEHMMTCVRAAPPTSSAFPNRILWALLATIADDDHGAAAREEVRAATHVRVWPPYEPLCTMLDAVAAGRRGDRAGAGVRYAEAAAAIGVPLGAGTVEYFHLLAAEAALRDGWGEPTSWARRAEAFFVDAGMDRVARRCRQLLAEAGAPVPRRSRGGSAVPAALRAVGVTSREFDVLTLVAQGMTNREIAEHLVLSTKTVERHLSSLFDRTGVRNRGELGDYARQIG